METWQNRIAITQRRQRCQSSRSENGHRKHSCKTLQDLYYLELNECDNTNHEAVSPSSSNTSEKFDEIQTIKMEEVDDNNGT